MRFGFVLSTAVVPSPCRIHATKRSLRAFQIIRTPIGGSAGPVKSVSLNWLLSIQSQTFASM